MCSRSVALFVPVLSIPESPLASPDRKAKGAKWLGLVLCVSVGHSGISLELGCFQPALLCQVLLIQEHVVGVFPLERRSIAAFSLLCLLASLGSLCSPICRGHPALRGKAREEFPISVVSVLFLSLKIIKNPPKQYLKEKLFHHTQLLFPTPSDLCSPPQGCSSISWCWPHGLP